MLNKVEKLLQLRRFLLTQISQLTPDQLNEIPAGFRNNIIWNVAHLGAAVQSLCYGRSGLPFTVAEQFIMPFLPGTAPVTVVDAGTIEAVQAASLAALDQLAHDVQGGRFTAYSGSTFIQQRYGVQVESLDDALDFLLYHEGFHTGYILALKKLVEHAVLDAALTEQ